MMTANGEPTLTTAEKIDLEARPKPEKTRRMRHVSPLALLVLGVGWASAQPVPERTYGPIIVDTKYGQLVFSNVTLWQSGVVPKGALLPWFSASIQNLTGTSWHVTEFDVVFRCPGSQEDARYRIIVPTIELGANSLVFKETSPQVVRMVPCDPQTIALSMVGGWSDREREDRDRLNREQLDAAMEAERQAREQAARDEAEAERKSVAAQRAAEQKARAKRNAEEKAEREYLARFPILNSGASTIFVGSDRKCSEQFVQALSMEGLEKRKRLAELVSYGCGFIEDSNVHAMRLQAEGSYCQVRLVNGKHLNEMGWVPCSWVK